MTDIESSFEVEPVDLFARIALSRGDRLPGLVGVDAHLLAW
jgi:hypothetical protein